MNGRKEWVRDGTIVGVCSVQIDLRRGDDWITVKGDRAEKLASEILANLNSPDWRKTTTGILTKQQITALQWLVFGGDPFHQPGRSRPNCGTKSTLVALIRRGLVVEMRRGGVKITTAGRLALARAEAKEKVIP
jgi:hypothetical protein